MKARHVVLTGVAVLLAAGVTACGGSKSDPAVVSTGPGALATEGEMFGSGPDYTLKQVRAAFAKQGITLRTMRGASRRTRVVVLFDSRWGAPSRYHYVGKRPPSTLFVVFVHRNAQNPGWLLDKNVWLAYRHAEWPRVRAALIRLGHSSKS